MVPGNEDRKDPAAALYTHLATSSKVLFYDIACSLSKYVKNRESGYFRYFNFFTFFMGSPINVLLLSVALV